MVQKNEQEIFVEIKEYYKHLAETYERELKRRQAAKIYEKVMRMKISVGERDEVKQKLMTLYEKLGRIKEYYALKEGREKFLG